MWRRRALGPWVAPPADGQQTVSSQQQQAPRKRLVAAVASAPTTFNLMIGGALARTPGIEALALLAHSGLSIYDDRGELRPQLAETIPTVENGLWKVFPDGRMELTFTIRQGAQWHDGTPLTTDDLLFTLKLHQDQDMPVFFHLGHAGIERAEARDSRTVVTYWRSPFVAANNAFGFQGFRSLLPVPRHLLERPLAQDKATFTDLPIWSSAFVGAGPFKLREWVVDSHVVLEANDRYVLGRPKIDEVEVRFIPASSTLVANLLAGSVDLTMGRTLVLEQAMEVLNNRAGLTKMDVAPAGPMVAYPQFMNARPAILTNLDFRRALLHAVDRQEMVDTLVAGQTSVAHTFVHPTESNYAAVEAQVVRYDFDPRRASQLLEGIGLTRDADGSYRDSSGARLTVEVRSGAGGLLEKAALTLADAWRRAGVGADLVVVPPQLDSDVEYKATFPGFEVVQRLINIDELTRVLHSAESPLAENRYRGGNRGRYISPDLDALLDRYAVTMPGPERSDLLGKIVRHVGENAVIAGLFWGVDATVYSSRVRNVHGAFPRSMQSWNAHEWELE
ncbi:MAG: hypothetical protein HW416_3085 [Chloroflexi bacterium]|nr:hypothetical protein [Chloroflexota bacterium]